jgi:hypothetical protein
VRQDLDRDRAVGMCVQNFACDELPDRRDHRRRT